MYKILGISVFLLIVIFAPNYADASHNSKLFVSAENPLFENTFSGSMVIEVIVRDSDINKLDKALGEPSVTFNGKTLRMVQASDGNWYAYFANKDKAKIADNIASGGVAGTGLDFGVFCSADTNASVLGVSFSDTDGVAIPHGEGITGETNGNSSFSECTGTPSTSTSENNVVRNPRSVNKNSNVSVGQIGIDADIWPVVQLFSFGTSANIQYNAASGTQRVELDYNEIENISLSLDRDAYPNSAQVFVTINDMQLNQDPTDEDSWTFVTSSTQRTFYHAFDESGSNAANGGTGLINLKPSLSSLGFDNNGKVSLTLGNVAELSTNQIQPSSTVTDGTTTFSNIVTFVETQPNSGIFVNSDYSDQSNIKIKSTAPRGQSATINYNSDSYSILSGTSTATMTLDTPETSVPGKKSVVRITDPDQNLNSGSRDNLSLFRSATIMPSIQLGNPITLEKASELQFYPLSTSNLVSGGTSITSTINDTNSDILIANTKNLSIPNFEKISLNLGISTNTLKSTLLDVVDENNNGTNWINFDLRSFENQLDLNDFSDTSMSLYFQSLGGSFVTILDSGDISSAQGLVRIDNADVESINSKSGDVFLVINFDDSGDSDSVGAVSSETDKQPIVFDLLSFGVIDSEQVNNAIYRFELKETNPASGIFEGSLEYVQTNQFNESFVNTLRTIDKDVKMRVSERLLDEEGINLTYSDVSVSGGNFDVSIKEDVKTTTGSIMVQANSYRMGQPVKVILTDPDLNQNHDVKDVYITVNDPDSSAVDTVGDSSGNILLEIMMKGFRYQRCTINGVETGGLASTGFSLVETGPSTGVFEGVFRVPTQMCNKDGTELTTPVGGSIEIKYHDARDASGQPNIFGLSSTKNNAPAKTTPNKAPNWIKDNARLWAQGTLDDTTFMNGIKYLVNQKIIQTTKTTQSSGLSDAHVPSWIKNNADWWSKNLIPEDDFLKGIEYLIENGIIKIS